METSSIISDVLDMLTPEERRDPDIRCYLHHCLRAHREEKPHAPDEWTPAHEEANARGDWRTFSRLRGYTEDEIENFGEFVRLAYLLIDRYGDYLAQALNFQVSERLDRSMD